MEDKYLKEKFQPLKKLEVNPSTRIWNQIDGNLKSRREKSFQRVFNFSVAAALILIFSILISQFFLQKPESPPTAQELSILQKDSIKHQDSIKEDTIHWPQK